MSRQEDFQQHPRIERDDHFEYERECFSDFNKFVASFDALEEVRGKKNLQEVEGLREALANVNAWYASAVRFTLSSAGEERAQTKFWDGVKAQLGRREPKFRRVADCEKIQNSVLRQAALVNILNVEGAEAVLSEDNFGDGAIRSVDLKKEVKDRLREAPDKGIAWLAVELDELDAELPVVRVQKGQSFYFVTAMDAMATSDKRLASENNFDDARCFCAILNENDYKTRNGQPNPRTAAVIRIQIEEWLKRQ